MMLHEESLFRQYEQIIKIPILYEILITRV